MNNEIEYSESGSPIYRYSKRDKPFTPALGSPHMEEIEAHLAQHLGEPESVFHELASHLVHIDVHLFPPTQKYPFYTLATSGMSAQPMKAPEGYPEYQYAELLIHLPPDWPINPKPGRTNADIPENTYWPVRSLQFLTRFPHEYDTWLGPSHTIPNGDPPAPFADNTGFSGMMLIWPVTLPEAFARLELPEKTLNFYLLFPLYREEMEYKLKKGSDALLNRLNKAGISPVVDIKRKNACAKRFGLF